MVKTATKKAKIAAKKTAAQTRKTTTVSEKHATAKVARRPASKITFEHLRRWNGWLAVVHALQGIAVLIFSTSHSLPLTSQYLSKDTLASTAAGHPVLAVATRHLLDVRLAYLVAAFFFMCAIAHAVVATIYRERYETDLDKGINRARWIEYAVSASTMMVAIGFLTGIYDLSTLLLVFVLTSIMSLLGLAMEVFNQGKRTPSWLAYGIGCIAGIAPWIAVAIYVYGAIVYGSGNIPTFVYWIYGTMFILFSSFAVNMYLQYKQKGKWADYLYGERMYMILSLVAKSLLAWQIFAGALRP
ncbi:MAG TPA: heliorhodopsin HeR [Candidatus Saccharimonadales bacterium]|jgi:hypothetical protein|nr:heliorhodopsin HeR [Candidatus Saccharimonadales bacterium]